MIGSTGSGRDRAINDQGGLFTLVVQGLVDGAARRDFRVVSSVSRALAASTQWPEVLRCAENPDLELIFSNTTEVGIVLDESDAHAAPGESAPRSFPGKLTAFLLHRARWCRYDSARAPIVIPTELIEDNGAKLRDIVLTLARRWKTEPSFSAGSMRFDSATRSWTGSSREGRASNTHRSCGSCSRTTMA
jgi:tagaturonate reductase